MSRTPNPCHGCTDRRPGTRTRPSCHADCKRRADWLAEIAAEKAALQAAREAARPVAEYVHDSHSKAQRQHRWHKGPSRR